jgi:hypothetical protein
LVSVPFAESGSMTGKIAGAVSSLVTPDGEKIVVMVGDGEKDNLTHLLP